MRLVICDDNVQDLAKLEGLLQRYCARRPGVYLEIERFTEASLLLHKIQEEKPADLYLLDIVMSKITGIDLGNEIRKKSSRSMIIYVTASDGFALEAYDVHAVRYLLKPVDEGRLFEALEYALTHLDTPREPAYVVKTKNGLVSIPRLNIEYIENFSRRLQVHLIHGERVTSILIRKSFEEETKELMDDRNFICVHKSFLINVNHVRRLNQDHVVMDSGANIPVSKKRALKVKKEYLLFISDQCQ